MKRSCRSHSLLLALARWRVAQDDATAHPRRRRTQKRPRRSRT